MPLNIDPSLFEWCTWHKRDPAKTFDWLTGEELSAAGFNVNQKYKPQVTSEDMMKHLEEDVKGYHNRNGLLLDAIAKEAKGETVLVVGHAATVEVAHQRLVGTKMRDSMGLHRLMPSVTYCSFIGLEKDDKGKKWKLMDEGPFTVTHSDNGTFDKKCLVV